nr:retrovirus-related Pol polyprotein from transposon TNT 1-94 [Tanacetum cinerariifolium]
MEKLKHANVSSQTQKEIDELIAHVSEKKYAYGAIRAKNQNLLFIISELKTRLKNVERGIMQQFSTARTPQQNGVVKRRTRTLVKAARTMLIFSRLLEFVWAEAVATACFTQNRSIIHTRYNKTPYELLRGRKPNLEYFHVFGSLCYPTNDCDDLGKMKPKAYIGVFIEADELHQEDSADFDGNSQFVSYNPTSYEAIESSSMALEPLNVHNFHQVQPSTHSWRKDHPLDQVVGDPSKPVMTHQRLHTASE